eukprot:5467593-Prymnesium_polylepis.1
MAVQPVGDGRGSAVGLHSKRPRRNAKHGRRAPPSGGHTVEDIMHEAPTMTRRCCQAMVMSSRTSTVPPFTMASHTSTVPPFSHPP